MPEWLVQVLGPFGAAIAVYAGIRVDLALAKSKAEQALTVAGEAHGRIDRMLERAHG